MLSLPIAQRLPSSAETAKQQRFDLNQIDFLDLVMSCYVMLCHVMSRCKGALWSLEYALNFIPSSNGHVHQDRLSTMQFAMFAGGSLSLVMFGASHDVSCFPLGESSGVNWRVEWTLREGVLQDGPTVHHSVAETCADIVHGQLFPAWAAALFLVNWFSIWKLVLTQLSVMMCYDVVWCVMCWYSPEPSNVCRTEYCSNL